MEGDDEDEGDGGSLEAMKRKWQGRGVYSTVLSAFFVFQLLPLILFCLSSHLVQFSVSILVSFRFFLTSSTFFPSLPILFFLYLPFLVWLYPVHFFALGFLLHFLLILVLCPPQLVFPHQVYFSFSAFLSHSCTAFCTSSNSFLSSHGCLCFSLSLFLAPFSFGLFIFLSLVIFPICFCHVFLYLLQLFFPSSFSFLIATLTFSFSSSSTFFLPTVYFVPPQPSSPSPVFLSLCHLLFQTLQSATVWHPSLLFFLFLRFTLSLPERLLLLVELQYSWAAPSSISLPPCL